MSGHRGRRAASGASLTTLTLVASGAGDTTTITIPEAGRAAGNFALFTNYGYGGVNNPAIISGGTMLAEVTQDSADDRHRVYAKVLDGTETSFTGINGNYEGWSVQVYRPDGPILDFGNGASPSTYFGSGNPSAQSITVAAAEPLLFLYAALLGVVAFTPSAAGMDTYATTSVSFSATEIVSKGDTPVNRTVDMGDTGSANSLISGYITFNQ